MEELICTAARQIRIAVSETVQAIHIHLLHNLEAANRYGAADLERSLSIRVAITETVHA